MAIRVVIGAVLSAVLMMAWGFVFWMFTPWPQRVIHPLPNDEEVVKFLGTQITESGVFVSPSHPKPGEGEAGMDVFRRNFRTGPLIHMFYRTTGAEFMDRKTYLQGFCQYAGAALAVGIVLALARVGCFFTRFCMVLFMGVFAIVLLELGAPIWMSHDWDYHLMMSGFHAGNVLLMALVLAMIVKPPRAEQPTGSQSRAVA